MQKTDLTMDIPHAQDMNTVNMINQVEEMVDVKRETLKNSSQVVTSDSNKENCHNTTEKLAPIPENLAFMFLKDFYLKPRNTLLDVELSSETQQNYKHC